MIARGFKPVGWVAAVAGAALGCYMLSLNVAAERAELSRIERQILAAKQDIRSLQTELGTRGRLTQLEHWNSEVLALSAPASKQFLQNEFKLASYATPQESTGERIAKVRMASADIDIVQPVAKPAIVSGFASDESRPARPLVRQASLLIGAPQVQAGKPIASGHVQEKGQIIKSPPIRKAATGQVTVKQGVAKSVAPVKSASLIDPNLLKELGAASKAEGASGGAGTR